MKQIINRAQKNNNNNKKTNKQTKKVHTHTLTQKKSIRGAIYYCVLRQ